MPCKSWSQTSVSHSCHAYDEDLSELIDAIIVAKYAPLLQTMATKIQTLEWV